MRYLSLFILNLLFCQLSYGQNKIDSLKQELNKSEDQNKASLFLQLAKTYYYKDTDQLIYYSKKADSLATIYHIDSVKINALNYLSYASIYSGNKEDALSFNNEALRLSKSKHLNKEMISSLYYKGFRLYAIGEIDSSINVLNRSYKKAIDANELNIQIQCLNTTAASYTNQAKYKLALEKFMTAYQLADSLKLDDKLINISLNIGSTLMCNEDLQGAIGYFKTALARSNTLNYTLAYPTALNNIGACYSEMGQHKKAIEYFDKALPAYLKLNNKLQLSLVYSNLGQSHHSLKHNKLALKYLQHAIELNRKYNSKRQLIMNLILVAKLEILNNNFSEAKTCLEESQSLIEKHNISSNLVDLYKIYSLYYSKINKLELALDYKQKELNYRDSIFDVTRQHQISELQTKFETKQKIIENESLRKDVNLNKLQIEKQNQNNNYLILLSFVVFILFLILLNRSRIKKKSHQIIQNQKSELEIANKTKDKLFSIIAHDLRSPFNAIIGLSNILHSSYDNLNDSERKDFINDLNMASKNTYSLLDNLLTWARIQQGNIKIQIHEENLAELIRECILPHQATAKLKNITIEYSETEEKIVFIDKFSIKTVILNLINNAIKFSHEGSVINLSTEQKGSKTIISVSDHGVGMTPEQIDQLFKIDKGHTTIGTNKEKGTGLGLALCYEFVQKNEGQIWAESKEGTGSTFKFTVNTVVH
ncbi:tetratricopeptide repeat-containing sensor histidine kinase [Ancylomarina sp. 16SWW S1-10-2]|uniref:ATP-binding protein n=1 Tax=Ancylomarina sp. 16SWW S1-10-2 TaxID=2499681 RepID=UPI0012ADBD81|nr:tetratricopeptide repeat-containing sensor histidine kinase [Ancylomarina sp. 16SWW S1-10-2]MRT92948.1 sensor histidine kinase [Ancylomarina sp. 16SWW S1-10-2]